MTPSLGTLLHAFLVDELPLQKGFRPASTRAYRDGVRLFLTFVAEDRSCRLTQLTPEDMTAERAQRFLLHLEQERHNHRRTRNHRLAILKRTPPAETHFLEARRGAFPPAPVRRPLRPPRPCSRRPAHREPRPAGPAQCPAPRQGRQVAQLSPLAADGSAAGGHAPDQTAAAIRHDARLRLPRRTCPHSLRHLQDRPPTHTPPERSPPCDRPPHQPARLSAHGRRPSAGSRSRRKRDPRLARSRPPGYHQPVRRDHDPH